MASLRRRMGGLVAGGVLLALGCADDGGVGPGNESSSSGGVSTTDGVTSVSLGTTSAATNADTTVGAASSSSGGTTTVGTSVGPATTGTTGGMTTGTTGTTGTTTDTTTGGTSTSGTTGSSSSSSGGGPGCGNGAVEPGEQCDGADLQGFDCAMLGLGGGVLACDPVTCTFDTSGCMPIGNCGNGLIDPGEQCDGANLQGFDCLSLGFGGGGLLACDPVMCTFDTSMCIGGGGTSG